MTPKGGRGKKADYRTVQVRCPEPLKFTVCQMIQRWHAQEFVPQPEPTKLPAAMSDAEILVQMAVLGEEYSKRVPKSIGSEADELAQAFFALMEKEGLSQNEKMAVAARLAEELLG